MPISLKAMRYFVTVLRLGSIQRAAEELNIAASAVGSAIDQVEAQFGLPLVTRQRARGVTPTANGRALALRFERLLEEYEGVLAAGAELKEALSGSLRIGYYAPVAPAFLPAILSRLPADPGAISARIEECDNDAAQAGLLEGRFDVILFVSDAAQPSIRFEPLLEAPPYCLVPAGHALATVQSVTLAQIAALPLVVLDLPVAGPYYQRLFDGVGAVPQVVARANSTEMVRSLVGAGQGVAILNMVPVSDRTYGGDRVVAVPIADVLPPLSLALGYDPARPRRLVQAFVEACRAEFAEGRAARFLRRI
jgi:DNA-binding transcriptional LysR family regulator